MIDVLVVGMNFGREFLHLYQSHPGVGRVAICDLDAGALARVGDLYGITDRYTDLSEVLAGAGWDVVHIASPVHLHVEHVLAVLRTGRSVACAVPLARDLDGVQRVIDAVDAASGRYMMMETALYQREHLYAHELKRSGRLGRLTYLRASHIQDLDGFPSYWMGYPPMQYATHVVAPILSLAEARATTVRCLGSGRLLPSHQGDGANPFPVEIALFELDRDDLAAEATVAFFQTARSYTEGFDVYGDMGAMEWQSVEGDPPVTYVAGPQDGRHRGRPIERSEHPVPDYAHLLPEALRRFTYPTTYSPPGLPPIRVEAWHGGSHPHLVHELVSAVVQGRRPRVDEFEAARITVPGIVAHQSALRGGAVLEIPDFAR